MKASLKGRVDALEEARGAEFIWVMPLAYFYGENVERIKISRREMGRGLNAFYEEDTLLRGDR
jgi:hypothetical protein